jgi:hypothetical protein
LNIIKLGEGHTSKLEELIYILSDAGVGLNMHEYMIPADSLTLPQSGFIHHLITEYRWCHIYIILSPTIAHRQAYYYQGIDTFQGIGLMNKKST